MKGRGGGGVCGVFLKSDLRHINFIVLKGNLCEPSKYLAFW